MNGRLRWRSLGREDGFTLIEMVVTMVAGLAVLGATFMVLDFAIHASARATDLIESDQQGRISMEKLVEELHSSCVAASLAPVQAGSDSTHLEFVSQFGSAPVLMPNMHVVTFAGAALTDAAYAATGGSAPSWTFSATPTVVTTLGTHLTQSTVGGVVQPVFQYYSFVNGALSTTPLPTPLSAANAADTVEVTVSYAVGPSDSSTDATRQIDLSDSVVLRFIPASGTSSTPNLPCQ